MEGALACRGQPASRVAPTSKPFLLAFVLGLQGRRCVFDRRIGVLQSDLMSLLRADSSNVEIVEYDSFRFAAADQLEAEYHHGP